MYGIAADPCAQSVGVEFAGLAASSFGCMRLASFADRPLDTTNLSEVGKPAQPMFQLCRDEDLQEARVIWGSRRCAL